MRPAGMADAESIGKEMSSKGKSPDTDYREEFKATLTTHNNRKQVFWFVVFVGMISLLLVPSFRQFWVAGLLVCWAIGFFGSSFLLRLVCPACHKNLDDGSGRFCPACGANAIDKPGFWSLGISQCGVCEAKLSKGKAGRRNYKLRFCTQCGVHVHDQGL